MTPAMYAEIRAHGLRIKSAMTGSLYGLVWMSEELLGERELSKLRWRCRRGLLENDLLIEKFFNRFEATLTIAQAKGMGDLMDLSDNDLLDLLLRRKEPAHLLDADSKASASTFEAMEVLNLLRPQGKTLNATV